jgi:anaerobic selenocysteine-containing dehydrogenase
MNDRTPEAVMQAAQQAVSQAQRDAAQPVHTRYGVCNLCEAICGLEFKVQGGRVVSIKGDAADPFSRGHLCPKAVALKDLHEDPERLRRPVKRVGEQWQEISWDEAFSLAVEGLARVREAHGADAVAVYQGNPTVHSYGQFTHGIEFFGLLNTRHRYSATSVDQLPHQLVAWWLYGHQLLLPIPDIDRTQYLLMLGANPMVSNGSLMSAPDIRQRLKDLKSRGGKLVVIDPRRTETAALADEHHFIRPGKDAALLLAMLHTLFDENLVRPGRLAAWLDGVDAVRAAVQGYAPEAVAEAVGIPAPVIRRLARELAAAEAGVCYGRIGVSVQEHGVLAQWAIQMLNILCGHLDRPGGALFTQPAADLIGAGLSGNGHYDRYRSRVRGLPEFGGELPVVTMAEEMLTPGQGQVRALVVSSGNPVLSTPNGRQLDKALAGLEFMVAFDFYINETTRHAHVILPSTCALERDHYDMIFLHLAVRNYARYSPAVLPKPAGMLHDWEIFRELVRRYEARLPAARRGTWMQRLRRRIMRGLRPDQQLALALRMGPHKLRLSRLRRQPHGVDLGPLQPSLPQRLRTPGKRIALLPRAIAEELQRVRADLLTPPAPGELVLIGRRELRSNNSWMHNHERLVKGPVRCVLLMHPEDAAARALVPGQRVSVSSRVGEVLTEVRISDEVAPGVVSLPHGWGHARAGVRLSVAREHAGVSINDLTDERLIDRLSGNAALNAVTVRVQAAPEAGHLAPDT